MGPFRGPYRGSPLRDPCWWAVSTEVAAHWEEVLMGLFRGGTHKLHKFIYGLKQTSKQWHFKFDEVVTVNGFKEYIPYKINK